MASSLSSPRSLFFSQAGLKPEDTRNPHTCSQSHICTHPHTHTHTAHVNRETQKSEASCPSDPDFQMCFYFLSFQSSLTTFLLSPGGTSRLHPWLSALCFSCERLLFLRAFSGAIRICSPFIPAARNKNLSAPSSHAQPLPDALLYTAYISLAPVYQFPEQFCALTQWYSSAAACCRLS